LLRLSENSSRGDEDVKYEFKFKNYTVQLTDRKLVLVGRKGAQSYNYTESCQSTSGTQY